MDRRRETEDGGQGPGSHPFLPVRVKRPDPAALCSRTKQGEVSHYRMPPSCGRLNALSPPGDGFLGCLVRPGANWPAWVRGVAETLTVRRFHRGSRLS